MQLLVIYDFHNIELMFPVSVIYLLIHFIVDCLGGGGILNGCCVQYVISNKVSLI